MLGAKFYLMGFVDGWSPMDINKVWPAPLTAPRACAVGRESVAAPSVAGFSGCEAGVILGFLTHAPVTVDRPHARWGQQSPASSASSSSLLRAS